MTVPCEQKDSITYIQRTLDRMEISQQEIVRLMTKLADHNARIDHLEEHAETSNALFDRVRKLEIGAAGDSPKAENNVQAINEATARLEDVESRLNIVNTRLERVLGVYKSATGKPALYVVSGVLAMIVLGFISDLANHGTWLRDVWKFYRG